MCQVKRGWSKCSLSTILASTLRCLSVQECAMSYEFGKLVETPCQYYRSLSGSSSLCDASHWLFHCLLFWPRQERPEMEVKWINPCTFSDTYLHVHCSLGMDIPLIPNHYCSYLTQGCRPKWTGPGLTPVENLARCYAIPQMLLPWPADWAQDSILSHHSKFSCWLSSLFCVVGSLLNLSLSAYELANCTVSLCMTTMAFWL